MIKGDGGRAVRMLFVGERGGWKGWRSRFQGYIVLFIYQA
jgi:hypothetical protein